LVTGPTNVRTREPAEKSNVNVSICSRFKTDLPNPVVRAGTRVRRGRAAAFGLAP